MLKANARAPHLERRERQRFPVRLMLAINCGDGVTREAVLRDASELGIAFFCDTTITAGSAIEFSVKVPPEVAEIERVLVRGKGKVVRCQPQDSGRVLVAAVTYKYEFEE